MIDVGRKIFSFLIVLLIILLSFSHAFWVLLTPRQDYNLDDPIMNDDPNNPWSLTSNYNQVGNEEITPNTVLVQKPDMNTNLFTSYATSIFATYLFLTGDSSAFSNWEYQKNAPLTILMVVFSLLIAIYLMNLLIGLLNMHIEKDNRAAFLKKKAKILAEIELLYLLPNQRRWKSWFPDIIYYYASVDLTRQNVKQLIEEGEWNNPDPDSSDNSDNSDDPDTSENTRKQLLEILEIQDPGQELEDLKKKLNIIQKEIEDNKKINNEKIDESSTFDSDKQDVKQKTDINKDFGQDLENIKKLLEEIKNKS